MDDFSLAMIAKLYYIDKIKQKEIANMYNTSPMVISRLIKEAEERGIVHIDITMPTKINLELSTQLKEKYGFKDCVVLENVNSESGITTVAKFLADYAVSLLPENGVLGVSWGNTIGQFADYLRYQNREDCTVLELTGGFYARDGEMKTPTSIIIKICQKLRADHMMLNAPYYVQSLDAKNELKEDLNNKLLTKLAREANINIISASAFSRESTTSKYGVITEEDFKELEKFNPAGDIAGVFVDKSGEEINWSKHDLYMGVPISILNKADNVICVAAGKMKKDIIQSTSGTSHNYFNILITDEELARELIYP